MKQVVQLDKDGYFVGFTFADESPLEPGVYLIPGGAIDTSPPSIATNQKAKWENGTWVFENIPEPEQLEPFKPTAVTMRQARLALLQAGLLSQVDTAINSITDPLEKQAAQIEWEYATVVDRNSQFVQNLAAGLELTEEQLDQLFTTASSL
jgi:hypothetical protein